MRPYHKGHRMVRLDKAAAPAGEAPRVAGTVPRTDADASGMRPYRKNHRMVRLDAADAPFRRGPARGSSCSPNRPPVTAASAYRGIVPIDLSHGLHVGDFHSSD